MNPNDVCIVILAAGKGARMKSSKPKVFHKIAGLPILGHIIAASIESCVGQIITVLSPHANLSDIPEHLRCVNIARQNVPLGTGDAALVSIPSIKECINYVLILYGDTPLITSNTITEVVEYCKKNDADACVLGINLDSTCSFGRLSISGNTVKAVVEESDATGNEQVSNICNVGILIKKSVAKKYLPYIRLNQKKKEMFLTDIIALMHKGEKKCLYKICPTDEMYGINTMKDLAKVELTFQNKIREKFMMNGVRMISPDTVFFSYDTEIEPDVIIHPYVTFGNSVKVKSGTIIHSFSHIEGAIINDAIIGPFARIRFGSEINKGAKIGNFVEIKSSLISSDAKISHLSYIGDSNIGRESNIGAGTITCNYDGFEKHKTKLGNNVFVGSNTSLIAPINVGDGAIIAAGSVVTGNIDENSLAISRPEQSVKKGAANRFRNKRSKD